MRQKSREQKKMFEEKKEVLCGMLLKNLLQDKKNNNK